MSYYTKSPFTLKQIGSSRDNQKNLKTARQCNCKRSNCLKLYCECFANGVYCNPKKCNCNLCFNNSENEIHRRAAVELTMDRNPNAFRPKIVTTVQDGDGSTRHHKGCHCKKSNCLKKYCECFQANTVCSERCRCTECKNFVGSVARINLSEKQHLQSTVATLCNPFNSKLDSELESNSSESTDQLRILATNINKEPSQEQDLQSDLGSNLPDSNCNLTQVPRPIQFSFETSSLQDVLSDKSIKEICSSILSGLRDEIKSDFSRLQSRRKRLKTSNSNTKIQYDNDEKDIITHSSSIASTHDLKNYYIHDVISDPQSSSILSSRNSLSDDVETQLFTTFVNQLREKASYAILHSNINSQTSTASIIGTLGAQSELINSAGNTQMVQSTDKPQNGYQHSNIEIFRSTSTASEDIPRGYSTQYDSTDLLDFRLSSNDQSLLDSHDSNKPNDENVVFPVVVNEIVLDDNHRNHVEESVLISSTHSSTHHHHHHRPSQQLLSTSKSFQTSTRGGEADHHDIDR